MRVGSLFSGVGGFDMGLEAAGMKILWQVEIDPQARAVLRHHWPDVDLHEDVRNVGSANLAPVDLICGGFPCQDLSVAGRRAGLAGERSGLFYEFMRVVDELAPRWVLIENVPGLLSSNGGRDMGAVVGTLAELGYGWTYRVLDLQHFGVPQRRRRVFIVGRAGGFCPPEILLEPESLPGDSPAREETGQEAAGFATAGTLDARQAAGGFPGTDGAASGHVVAFPLTAREGKGPASSVDSGNIVAHQCHGTNVGEMGTGRGTPIVADTLTARMGRNGTANADRQAVPLAFNCKQAASHPNGAGSRSTNERLVAHAAIPRRLTPRECERLMGWPDDWTRYGITDDGREVEMKDGPRYRMCGNGVGAPVAEWIGRRIVAAV